MRTDELGSLPAEALGRSAADLDEIGQTFEAEQYALRAKQAGFYPVMERGLADARSVRWLEEGDVWKFGITKNGTNGLLKQTRYDDSYLQGIGDFGVKYSPEFQGTRSQASTLEQMKIRNHIHIYGRLPAGNKIVGMREGNVQPVFGDASTCPHCRRPAGAAVARYTCRSC